LIYNDLRVPSSIEYDKGECMKNGIKPFQNSSFILLALFQIVMGVLGFVISGKISQYSWLINMLFLWLGITIGMYLGGIPFLFQKSFTPKKSLVRFVTTALGASIPVLLLILLGIGLGIHDAIYIAAAPIIAFLALALSLLGFFMPGWIPQKRQLPNLS
jgi:hypothetical protein